MVPFQAAARLHFPELDGVMAWVGYSDASLLSAVGAASFHPFNLYCANGNLESMRAKGGYLRWAMLPVLDRKHFDVMSADEYALTR